MLEMSAYAILYDFLNEKVNYQTKNVIFYLFLLKTYIVGTSQKLWQHISSQ